MTRIGQWLDATKNSSTLIHAARSAGAAVVSYLIARLFSLPEAYWAPISTLNVNAVDLGRGATDLRAACCGNGARLRRWGRDGHLLPRECLGRRRGYFSDRNSLRRLSRGALRLPLCKYRAGN